MEIFDSLIEKLKELEKTSKHKAYYYRVSDSLTIMICGMLSSLQNISDIYDWAQEEPIQDFLYEQFGIYKIPSRAQFYNLIGCVKPEKFTEVFVEWVSEIVQSENKDRTIAIDGKTICSTDQRAKDGQPLHILSAIVSESKLIIGSLPCDSKISEPQIFRKLADILDISGAMLVADALHCQKESAAKVVAEGGDYLFVVKENQPTLHEEIELYFQDEETENYSHTEKNGGRIEKRTAYVSTDIEWLSGKKNWENLTTIGAIHTEFIKGDKRSSEWHYYISSRKLTAQELLKHARLEWAVESMHWLLDVHFSEDKTKVWDMNVQQNLNTMRKIALNLARIYKDRYVPRSSISGVLKRNLFNIANLANFINNFVVLIDVTILLRN